MSNESQPKKCRCKAAPEIKASLKGWRVRCQWCSITTETQHTRNEAVSVWDYFMSMCEQACEEC